MEKDEAKQAMERQLEYLKQRRSEAEQMGGEERVAKQHALGKLTARERIALLLDSGSFREYGLLATHQSHRQEMSEQITPADGVITGFGKINGRSAGILAEDFTVRGGSVGQTNLVKKIRMVQVATQEKIPLVWMLDGAGARAEEFISEGLPMVTHLIGIARLSGISPQVGIVMGPSAGDSSLCGSLLEFIIMTRHTGMMAAGGPPVVKAAMGFDISKEELGGWKVHCAESGVADNPAEDDKDAIEMTKRYLSYLPGSAYEYPPYLKPDDDPNRMDEELLSILPENLKRQYDMKRIINCVVDQNSFFEIKPLYAPEMITGFARLNGHPVGIIANQPLVMAGAITARAAMKERHFIDLCNAYHVPLIFLVDVPGVMPGPEAEKAGALRFGLAVAYSLAYVEVPRITVVIHKAFGFGGCAMCGYGGGQTLTLAWPRVEFGSIPSDGGVLAAYKSELARAEDPAALQKELEAKFNKYAGPYPAAGIFNIDDVIDPRETRPRLIEALELALNRRAAQPQPVFRFGVMP